MNNIQIALPSSYFFLKKYQEYSGKPYKAFLYITTYLICMLYMFYFIPIWDIVCFIFYIIYYMPLWQFEWEISHDSCIFALGPQLVVLLEGNCGLAGGSSSLATGCFQVYFASCVLFAVEVIVSQLPTVTTCPCYGLSLWNRRTKINSFSFSSLTYGIL